MLFLVIFLQITLINSFNVTDTTSKIKFILNNYKSNRQKRCFDPKIDSFVKKTLNLFERTRGFGQYLQSANVSDCVGANSGKKEYLWDHVTHGLIVNHDVPPEHWEEFKAVYNKQYESFAQEMAALSQWRENLRRVAEHNLEYLAGKQTYSLHLNHFGDFSNDDYFKKILKLIDTVPLHDPFFDHKRTAYQKNRHRNVPKEMDWRARGFKPRREQQWECGACYAFAVTHVLQAQLFRKHLLWTELSPQQIVDCSTDDGNMGCGGGSLRGALRYAARKGLVTEKKYPYSGKKGHCKVSSPRRVRPRRWATLPAGDEAAIEKALALIGPLAVALNASPFTFKLYRSGVYDDPFCTSWGLNHAMLLIGYTPEYWLLLNWWGKEWGEDGYIRIRRGFNRCGVANMATYVEL